MRVLITGGAGFIGSNTVDHLLRQGHEVIVLDNLSRKGSEINLQWLRRQHGAIPFEKVDVRDAEALQSVMQRYHSLKAVFHFAAQVAVTSSVSDPRYDFEVNALGTFNLLEAVRRSGQEPVVLFTSTNKVYGALEGLGVEEGETRYRLRDLPNGVSEDTPLDFYSPYGCSKGTADQYVRDYHRIFGLRTVVFRNSCIYGRRQFGVEDQGWLAWFVIAAERGLPIRIYGDGKQVRDVLFVDDLIQAMLSAIERGETTAGQVYNMGGGPGNSLAIWREFGPLLETRLGHPIEVSYDSWRPGDQKIYVSDISKARRQLGWQPTITPEHGIGLLQAWVHENRDLFA
jgi:CDP-paratose 2-epimerase